jgi:DNA primase
MSTRVDIPTLLEKLGIRATRGTGERWLAPCPSAGHRDSDPSWSIRDDDGEQHGSHWCFGCGFGGGPWELAAEVLGLSLEIDPATKRCEAGEWVWQNVVSRRRRAADEDDLPTVRIVEASPELPEMMLPPGVVIPSVAGCGWHPAAEAYLDGRGVEAWQRERWHLGYATRGRCAWRVVIPVHTRGRLVSYAARLFIDDPGRPRYDAARGSDLGARPELALFGEPGFDPDLGVVTVTEGAFKALAMERAGAPNPCAILGASNMGPEKLEILASFRTVLSAFDPDQAGARAHEQLRAALARYCDVRPVPLHASPDDQDEAANAAAWKAALMRRRRTA